MWDYLSGNVPGGFGLYLLFIVVTFLVLRAISQANDLFTPQHFRRWFLGIWLLATVLYSVVWLRNPPTEAFERYSVQFYSENPQNSWVAFYLRDEMEKLLVPQQKSTNYFFPQRWNLLTGETCEQFAGSICENIAVQFPVNQLVLGNVRFSGDRGVVALTYVTYPDGKTHRQTEIAFDAADPAAAIAAIRNWLLSIGLPVEPHEVTAGPFNQQFAEARQEFWLANYKKAEALCREALRQNPDNSQIKQWLYYTKIRIAGEQRAEDPPSNPFEQKRKPWQTVLAEAQNYLIPLAKANYQSNRKDALLSNMIAESFMFDGKFGDAETFLKISFGENPLLLETLKNFIQLHPARYEGLPFKSEKALMARILTYCPFEEVTLQKYIEMLLTNLQVNNQPAPEIRERLELALRLVPNHYTALLLKGKYHLAMFDYEAAAQVFERARKLHPEEAVPYYNLGVVKYYQKQYDAAFAEFQKAVEIGNYLDAYLYLGVLYQQRGEYEKALEHFRYRVARKTGPDDYYAIQAMKGIRECLKALNIPIPDKKQQKEE
jgi:tetratricopeptide (TPR) repeat protein